MIMSSRLYCFAALVLSSLLASGCSSDSGNNGQSNLSGVPRPITDDSTGTTPATTDTPTAEATPPTSDASTAEPAQPDTDTPTAAPTPPVSEPPTTETSPPATTTDPDVAPTPGTLDVNNLLGNVRFVFSFNDSSDVFTLEKRFTADAAGVSEISGLPFVQAGIGTTTVTRCSIIPDELPYFCAEATAESATAVSFRLFRFNLDAARNGTGTFEFCPSDITAEACTVDAFTTPDGSVTVSVDAANAVAVAQLDISRQRITTDVRAHHTVAEQAQAISGTMSSYPELTIAAQRAIAVLKPALSAASASSRNR